MRALPIGIVIALAQAAHAQPVASVEPPPTGEPTPGEPASTAVIPIPPVAPPPPVFAIDGEARGYETAPEASSVRGSGILRGIGTGTGYLLRGLFLPIRGPLYLEARYRIVDRAQRLVTTDDGRLGVYPSLGYASGFGLTYGAKAFARDTVFDGDELSLSAKAGGPVTQQYQLKVEVPRVGASPVYVKSRVRYEENGNLLFAGIGTPGPATRFSQERFLTVLSTGVDLGSRGTRLRIGGSGIYNDRSFGSAMSGTSDPSIESVYDTRMLTGFDSGFRNLELTGDIELDTRDHAGTTGNGALVKAFAGGGSLIERAEYMHYGAEASYYVTPFWPGRVLVGRAALEGVRDRDNDLPFTELPRLGGAGLLRGYKTDQFRDRLAAIGTLEYHYPIHDLVSGQLFVETGKVAATYDALFGDGRSSGWHVGYGGGLIAHSRSKVLVRFDVAYGDGLLFYFSTDVLDAFRKREREL